MDDLLRNATPQHDDLGKLDLEITRAWTRLLKADSHYDIDKMMACVDALLDKRLLLTEAK
jgi:hypothetical protein